MREIYRLLTAFPVVQGSKHLTACILSRIPNPVPVSECIPMVIFNKEKNSWIWFCGFPLKRWSVILRGECYHKTNSPLCHWLNTNWQDQTKTRSYCIPCDLHWHLESNEENDFYRCLQVSDSMNGLQLSGIERMRSSETTDSYFRIFALLYWHIVTIVVYTFRQQQSSY